ncbi:MAG: CHASE2 domain-containing protein [Pseudoxanthomonas suwonensis]|nr:CHASE2 domain-containing protein [Pseudoxanthomonas suwonensis]
MSRRNAPDPERPPALRRIAHAVNGVAASAGLAFMDVLDALTRTYRRPLALLAKRTGFGFYPLLALAMLGWLAWDGTHAQRLAAAEDAVFDQLIRWRPLEPTPSAKVAVVEIDDCSIEHFRARGEGGWPWGRQRHADLIDALDRAGVQRIGFDVLFADPGTDTDGDAMLEAMAAAGEGRFVFASTRLHPGHDAGSPLRAGRTPGAWPLRHGAVRPGPQVAMILPYGEAMARHSGLVNLSRAGDGVVRDVRLYERVGDWAIPSLPLRLARQADVPMQAAGDGWLRINWRSGSPLEYVSAADLLAGEPVCGTAGVPDLRDRTVLVGHTAAGINDAKPTPVNMAMPGVEVLAEATEALISGNAITMPPAWLKYLLAALLVLGTGFVFWRGEPHEDVDVVFASLNGGLLVVALVALNAGVFIDIFASVGFGALCFGLCRGHAALQRGRVIGNHDYLPDFDPAATPWLGTVRLRFVANRSLAREEARRCRREYRRLLRRFLYRSDGMVLIEGVIERKSWLVEQLEDLVQLVWRADSEAALRARMRHDLDALHALLHGSHARLDDGTRVWLASSVVRIDPAVAFQRQREQLRPLYQQDFNHLPPWPLSAANPAVDPDISRAGVSP